MKEASEPTGAGGAAPTAENRLGLDYRAEATRLGPPPVEIIDVHTHINGARAARVWAEAAQLYGVGRTYSQTQRAEAYAVREVLGERIRFIAIPEYMDPDKQRVHRQGFVDNVRWFHDEMGARMVKFWNAPRFRDFWSSEQDADIFGLESPWKLKVAELATELGMMFMTHVGDPDTWFKTTYADSKKYGTKLEQYAPLERMLQRFPSPWLAAHMAGWPEDLDFISGLLERHDNLYIDTSATKWMVRELSKHPRDALLAFLERWRGRVLFGSDVVTIDEHLRPTDPEEKRFGAALAHSPEQAFELYASRSWALRTMFETDYDGESPIADPDLAMVEPDRYDAMSAPRVVGRFLPSDLLRSLYRDAAAGLVEAWWDRH
ncbi:MAG: amidohydrolase family protein [Phycisphaerales bacterium JB039]